MRRRTVGFLSILAACSSGGSSSFFASTAPPGGSFQRTFVPDSVLIKTVDAPAGAVWTTEPIFGSASFQNPTYLTSAKDGSKRLFVCEQRGVLTALAPVANPATDTPVTSTFLDLGAACRSGGEEGLLSCAFDPGFKANGRVYVTYTTGQNYDPTNPATCVRTRLSRFTLAAGNPDALDPASEVVLLEVLKSFSNHNGGQLQFGPDGMLYMSVGDGGGGGDPEGSGQNLGVLKAKILRIDPSQGSPYAIPADNPFVGTAGAKGETWAYGLRNPWRFSFDRANGGLWVGDVGQNAWEEVDLVTKGGNYGWNAFEGTYVYSATQAQGALPPVVEYDHATTGSCVIGGYVYRGSRLPALVGSYVYADFATGHIWALVWDGTKVVSNTKLVNGSGLSISSFGEDEAGELYLVSYNGGIHRLAQTGGGVSSFPQTLSATGLFADLPTQKLRREMIPYGVNEAFWSDGATKARGILLPHLDQIVRTDKDAWQLPADAIVAKSFSLGTRIVETRLLVHTNNQWYGYSYEWNAQGTDATLLPTSKHATIGAQDWYFPGRGECARCHTGAAGTLLGIQTAQLDGTFDYTPFGGPLANQLSELDALGAFSTPLGAAPSALPRFSAHGDTTATLDERARSYLHVNCSMCHRPGGGTNGQIDLRHDTPLASTGLAGVTPIEGDLGVTGAKLVVKGDPSHSMLWIRMTRTDQYRMPPLASSVVDQEGAKLVSDWISSLP